MRGAASADLERLEQMVVKPSGFTASCLRGSSCRALVGRTHVFVWMPGEPVEKVIASARVLAEHLLVGAEQLAGQKPP
jgi:hypothetical protein